MRQSAQAMPTTAARSRALRSELASFESSRHAPASTVQFGPSPELTVRLKSSKKSTPPAAPPSVAPPSVVPPSIVPPSIVPPSIVPPSGTGGGGGGASGIGAKTRERDPELFASGV